MRRWLTWVIVGSATVALAQSPLEQGTVTGVMSRWVFTEYGDAILVSDINVVRPNGEQVTIEVDGGTAGDVTLTVDGLTVPGRGQKVWIQPKGQRWVLEQDFSASANWAGSEMVWLLDTRYAEIAPTLMERDVRQAAVGWTQQTGIPFTLTYGGRIPDGSGALAYDQRNAVVFRPTLNPKNSASIASTYWWAIKAGHLVDVDVVGWSGKVNWLADGASCLSNGADVISIFAHEFGHAIGMLHSSVTDATMYYRYRWCSQTFRSLAPDDIAGARWLYPPLDVVGEDDPACRRRGRWAC